MKAINRHLGLDICRQNRKVDGMKQSPYIIPALRRCADSVKDAKRIIAEHKRSEVMDAIKVPQKGFLRYGGGITADLKSLKVGGYIDVSHVKAGNSYACGNQIGIKVCTRKVSEVNTRVYRVS